MSKRSATAPRVLVVDDDWTTRETFEHMLRAEGYRVSTAPTLEAAGLRAAGDVPEALLLDLHMPLRDGLVCLRDIRTTAGWSGVPVAILTGDYFLDEDVARELGSLNALIHFKPLWEDDLRRIVQQLLSQRQHSCASPLPEIPRKL